MFETWLSSRIVFMIPILISLTIHEWAHALAAHSLGDPTAAQQDRLTLNPLSHMDFIGTLLLPLLGVPFGWARPVPVNPFYFKNTDAKTGMMIVAAAGPISNILLFILCTVITAVLTVFAPNILESEALNFMLQMLIFVNLILALFNLLPIYPLDGSRIVAAFIPDSGQAFWDAFCQVSPILLIAVIFLPHWAGVNIFDIPIAWSRQLLQTLVEIIR